MTGLALALALGAAVAPTDGGVPETRVVAAGYPRDAPSERASSQTFAEDMRGRSARSVPDALRFEPGVSVQQTGHAQASPFLRGLTGQQTVVLLDGVRLNTSIWRRGPNQYAFTVDARSLASIEVVRGGASTRYGADALGGALLLHPLEPSGQAGVRPSLTAFGATADAQLGGRLQLDAAAGPLGLIAGVTGRRAGLLQAAGPVRSPRTFAPADVPAFAADGRTQLGTGFSELAFDARSVLRAGRAGRLTLATSSSFQFDAPRTDQCPPRGGAEGDCLTYERQHRSAVWGSWDTAPDEAPRLRRARVTASWQRVEERRRTDRPRAGTEEVGHDLVDTFGVAATLEGVPFAAGLLQVGGDAWLDLVQSRAWLWRAGAEGAEARSRGQYVNGARAATGGVFAEQGWTLERLAVRAGLRVGLSGVDSPAEERSGSAKVARVFAPVAAHAGVELKPLSGLSLLANLDRSFRAPNLDDLTSRQATGAGYQLENPGLGPEGASSLELGAVVRAGRVRAQLWGFASLLDGAVERRDRPVSDCPPDSAACLAAPARFELVNARAPAWLLGAEGDVRASPIPSVELKATAAWAIGFGPNPAGATAAGGPFVPLSRIPPLFGTAEAGWKSRFGLSLGAALRWAALQQRLAPSDARDARIPEGGTPAWAVVDLRAGFRSGGPLSAWLVLENLFDTPYRVHGSGVNGPGRGLIFTVEAQPF